MKFGHQMPTGISKSFIQGLSERSDAMTNSIQELTTRLEVPH